MAAEERQRFLVHQWERQTAEGVESTSVWLVFHDNGELALQAQDMGPSVERIWGDADYEYELRIDAADVPRFIALVTEALFASDGDEDTFTRLRDACTQAGIRAAFRSWI